MGKRRPAIYFMYKKDLARWYDVTSKTLRYWITSQSALVDQLRYYGYEETDKLLTPKQIEVIFSHLGYPVHFDYVPPEQRDYFPLRIYTKSELLDLYRTTLNTFNRYLRRNADLDEIRRYYQTRSYIYPEDTKTIFQWLGWPWSVK